MKKTMFGYLLFLVLIAIGVFGMCLMIASSAVSDLHSVLRIYALGFILFDISLSLIIKLFFVSANFLKIYGNMAVLTVLFTAFGAGCMKVIDYISQFSTNPSSPDIIIGLLLIFVGIIAIITNEDRLFNFK